LNLYIEVIYIQRHTIHFATRMQKSISLDDVIASADKFGQDCVLTYNAKKARDLKTLNPKSPYDTTYIPLLFKHITGTSMPVKVKFSEQLIASGAKTPQSDDEGIPRHLSIAFVQMDKEDIEGGDYVPREMSKASDQEKEDTRVNDNIQRYMDNNKKFLRVLEILDNSYKNVCDEIKAKADTFNFRVKKDRNQKDITIFSIKQTTRLDRDTNKDEELKHPIYRLKIPVCKKDGRLGIWSNYHNKFLPVVFDARKMNKKNNYQQVPAKIKVDGKMRDLDVNNASSFIVYKSLIGGTIQLECVVISKFGFSLNNSFYDLYVYRHKGKSSDGTFTKEEIIQMRGGVEEDDEEESDAEINGEVDDDEDECNDDGTDEKPKIDPIHDSDDDDDDDDDE
jgi:hypothetical protein